jgi:hypothetical protein
MAVDVFGRVRALWQRLNPLAERARVDYEALIVELCRAADEKRRKIGQYVVVPCDYLISLSPRDMDDWEEGDLAAMLVQELQRGLADYVRERGYRVQGPVTVRMDSNDRLDDGYVGLTTSFAAYDPAGPLQASETVLRPPEGTAIASFEVVAGKQTGQSLPVTRLPATIGRVTHNNHPAIPLEDDTKEVSRRHALIEESRGSFYITDLGSVNGTAVNGQRLSPNARAPLPPGARVNLGASISLVFRVGERSTVTGWRF